MYQANPVPPTLPKPVEAPMEPEQPTLKDSSATGTDDLELQHVREAEQKLDKILSYTELPKQPRKRRSSKDKDKDKEEVFVDRI